MVSASGFDLVPLCQDMEFVFADSNIAAMGNTIIAKLIKTISKGATVVTYALAIAAVDNVVHVPRELGALPEPSRSPCL